MNRIFFDGLCSIFQRYKSKAIHNKHQCHLRTISAVFNLSKIQIESNSQLLAFALGAVMCCVQSFKDTNRKQFTTIDKYYCFMFQLCSIFQRYKSKAIHNPHFSIMAKQYAVFNLSKIQIESNSQLFAACSFSLFSCVQSFKDTNRKQFTTISGCFVQDIVLCSIFQRYKSKAIHNKLLAAIKVVPAVFNLSKIQIESNSQLGLVI